MWQPINIIKCKAFLHFEIGNVQRRLMPIISGGYIRRITTVLAWATYSVTIFERKEGRQGRKGEGGSEGGKQVGQ